MNLTLSDLILNRIKLPEINFVLEKLNLNLIFFVSCHVELTGHVEIVSSNLEGA